MMNSLEKLFAKTAKKMGLECSKLASVHYPDFALFMNGGLYVLVECKDTDYEIFNVKAYIYKQPKQYKKLLDLWEKGVLVYYIIRAADRVCVCPAPELLQERFMCYKSMEAAINFLKMEVRANVEKKN